MKQKNMKMSKAKRLLAFLGCFLVLSVCLAVACFAEDPITVDGGAIVEEMVNILVSGITAVATGLGTGLSLLVQSIFLSSTGGLSIFGVIILAFGGISLALGLCYKIVNMCTSLGN